MGIALRTFVTRLATPALLVTMVVLERMYGGDSIPAWMANAAVKTGAGVPHTVQALIALQLAGTAFALLVSSVATAVAWVLFTLLALTGLAELSAVFSAPGNTALPTAVWLIPLVVLAIGVLGLWAMAATSDAARAARAASPPARFTVWRLLLGVVIVAVSLGIGARTDVAERTTFMVGGVETVVFDPETWVGKTLPASGLARYLPALTPLTLESTKWIVFYQPSCGRCHEVFDAYFAGDQLMTVIAVKVPHAPDEQVLASDQRGEVTCTNCAFLSLPSGRKWLGITTPTIVKVENGTITCVEHVNYDRCRKGSDVVE